ncbi:MAG TPA: hypothetical protein VGC41_23735 [Kofleriaceae bacterium]
MKVVPPTDIIGELLRDNRLIARDVVAHGRTWLLLNNGVLNLHGPLTETDARNIRAAVHITLIQFQQHLDDPRATLQRLDRVLAIHTEARLSVVLNSRNAFDDLEFLANLPHLRSLLVDGNHALDLAPVAAHVSLVSLRVGGLGTSLVPLREYESLERLAVADRVTDFEIIGTLVNLHELKVRDRCPARLPFLGTLTRLRTISFMGAAPRRLDDLALVRALSDVTIANVKIDDATIASIGSLATLERLALHDLPRISSIEWIKNPRLEELELVNLEGVRSFAPLAELPRLRTLTIDRSLSASQLKSFAAAPALKRLRLPERVAAKISTPLPFAVEAI